ncbi:restriction endonuclease subunit S [Lactiplantibacillus plantarum]|uniref:restriction endonuclease subunit S n=1 Tax=Lactiplantibacillus plantarum TaxID=1590 RepID=UPI003F52B12C
MSNKVPQIRFNGYSDDWEERNLSDLATFSKGKGYSKSDLVSDGFPAILYGRMYTKYESQINDVNDTFVADATDAVLSQTGDVIVPGSGETPEDIARASNVNVSGVVLGGDINIIRPDAEKMDSTFLALTISNGQQQTELIKRAQGKSVVHLHNSDLKKVNVVAPSKDEQRAISSLFNQLDNLIAANQRRLDLLKEQKKGYLQKMFPKNGAKVPELRFAGFADDWEERKLGEFSDVRDGTHASPKYVSQGHPMVTSKNLTHSGLDMTDVSFLTDKDFNEINKRSKVSIGDILFGMIGTIGNPVIVDRDDFAIKNVALIKEKTSNPITNKWLLQYLKSPSFNRFIQKENAGGTQKFIALGLIRDMKLRVPEFDEQQKIGAFFKKIDDTIALHQRKLEKLQELKKGYLQKMFC